MSSAACTTCSSTAGAPPAPTQAHWPAVAALALGVFGLVTAEFLPASLLTAMAADLHVSEGTAGQTVTATALVAAVAAPSLPLLTRNLDRRAVMLALTVLLVLSNGLAVAATSLPALLVARVLLGVALGGFWSMSGALALRLVPTDRFARAMALILTGVSVATVCAAPIGAWMGEQWGWRSAFWAAGGVSLVTLVFQLATLPPLPPRDRPDLRVLAELLTRPDVRVALLAVLLVISGHFAGFTYIRPLMENVTHLSVGAITGVLLGYGIGGFFGNLVGGAIAERSERRAIVAGGSLVALLAGVLLLGASSVAVTAVAVVLWGFAFGAFPVGFQTWIVRAAPDQAEGAGGLLVAAFQVAIASGAIGGGLLVDHVGAHGGPLFALGSVTLGALLVWRYGPRPAQA
ncbi:MFS transporter [Pseudorhodoferax sp. Leaf265]|uniref:MFS transporter n=1 Tax=Pseudorhodoferax sp. Leaf265 TaxID=1736315 RepID=UPI0006FB1873|nr:MFS transporter [Pseudorhodoferax sp. Leaf265]KQP05071.1 transporter [Pseudorhodoferax sp. Leaf265]